MFKVTHFIATLLLAFTVCSATGRPVFAATIRILPTSHPESDLREQQIQHEIAAHFDVEAYREVRVQIIRETHGKPSYLLVHLHSKTYHSVAFARASIDSDYRINAVEYGYQLGEQDRAQQPERLQVWCPDPTVEFISFCPNDVPLEIAAATDVANKAKAKGLNTKLLLRKEATIQAYMNYMSCPNLKGNFYDGDADPEAIVAYDGLISSKEIGTHLAGRWKYKVTNIWLACQAYNDPMLQSMIDTAQSRKYAAGVNDLQVGPSDDTGV